jgi:transmembrane sensor
MDEIIVKFLQNKCSDEEKVSLFSWIDQSTENKEYYKRMRQLWDVNSLSSTDGLDNSQIDKAYTRLNQKLEDKETNKVEVSKTRKLLKEMFRYAAVAIICFGLSGLFWIYHTKNTPLAWQTIEVPIGQRIKITLIDGTTVWLNSKTKFTYPQSFAQNNRLVKLEGEAYFEVSHNAKLPFIVKTNHTNVTVKGTKFNIYAYENEPNIETTLVEGKIEFSENNPKGIKLDMKPNQQFVYNTNTKHLQISSNVDTHVITSWINGVHFFNKATIREIILRLEHYYNVQIIVKDSTILDYTCIGKFRLDESLNDVLKVISTGKHFKYKISENTVVIY